MSWNKIGKLYGLVSETQVHLLYRDEEIIFGIRMCASRTSIITMRMRNQGSSELYKRRLP